MPFLSTQIPAFEEGDNSTLVVKARILPMCVLPAIAYSFIPVIGLAMTILIFANGDARIAMAILAITTLALVGVVIRIQGHASTLRQHGRTFEFNRTLIRSISETMESEELKWLDVRRVNAVRGTLESADGRIMDLCVFPEYRPNIVYALKQSPHVPVEIRDALMKSSKEAGITPFHLLISCTLVIWVAFVVVAKYYLGMNKVLLGCISSAVILLMLFLFKPMATKNRNRVFDVRVQRAGSKYD